MHDCRFCHFQTLKIVDLTTDFGGVYYVYILKSKLRIHDCVFSPKKILEKVRYFSNDLPTVQFLKADNVLKRRFYTICPPIQRKRLWNCSRTCANLGKKPTTLIVGSLCYHYNEISRRDSSPNIIDKFHVIQSTNSIVATKTDQVILENFILDIRSSLIHDLDQKQMAKLPKFVDFNHNSVTFGNHQDLTGFYPLLFTPKINKIALFSSTHKLNAILPLTPNVKYLTVDFPTLHQLLTVPNYGQGSKLLVINCSIPQNLDYSLVANFLKKQRSNLRFDFYNLGTQFDLNAESLLRNFKPVKQNIWENKGISFTINNVYEFFVLR